MIKIEDIFKVLDNPVLHGDTSLQVKGVTHDSRSVEPDWAFVAMKGEKTDGHDYIGKAILNGAVLIVAEKLPADCTEAASYIIVKDSRSALGPIAALLNGSPTTELVLVGITGTNGKTTLTYLLESIIKVNGGLPGVVGTISYRWNGQEHPAAHTTPEASDLQNIFRLMADSGVTHAIIEVSSHGLHRGRLEGCHFDVGVFTNLTQDHLDYHGNFEDYFSAKKILFDRLLPSSCKSKRTAVINMDDSFGLRLSQEIPNLTVKGFGTHADSAVRPLKTEFSPSGILTHVHTPSGEIHISSSLVGPFNLMNILAAVAVADSLGISHDAIAAGIGVVKTVPGRLERVESPKGAIFVDYAHTPNALKNVLQALQMIRHGRIITIMGCGGDRDRTKRPLMGMEAAKGSDFVIITSDNPRSENPLSILDQVEQGVKDHGYRVENTNHGKPEAGRYCIFSDRREAIEFAVKHLREDDILLVAGKGHETYQEINGVRHPFDDRLTILEALKANPAGAADGRSDI